VSTYAASDPDVHAQISKENEDIDFERRVYEVVQHLNTNGMVWPSVKNIWDCARSEDFMMKGEQNKYKKALVSMRDKGVIISKSRKPSNGGSDFYGYCVKTMFRDEDDES